MNLKLTKSEFKLMAEGDNILQIAKAEALPPAAPKIINLTLEDVNGAKVNHRYNIENEKGMYWFSKLITMIYGDISDYDTSKLNEIVGLFLNCTIYHTVTDGTNGPRTWANVKSVNSIEYNFNGDEVTVDELPTEEDDL